MAILDVGSATRVTAVTPSDTTIVGCRALYVGGAGSVAVQPLGDFLNGVTTTRTFAAVPAGTILPVACARVMAATTATPILALF